MDFCKNLILTFLKKERKCKLRLFLFDLSNDLFINSLMLTN
ncbi:hypothetical protein Pf1_00353 [Flavobacterium columnare]|nr:hypothetical protein Pf1_00353 [Flavobacterium columnare]